MRVLLINPPYPVCESLTMPLGLLYLAARLEEEGHQVALEDLQLTRAPVRRLRGALNRFRPHVVGATSFSLNLHKASRLLKTAKTNDPRVLTVWGGPHVTFDDREILRDHPWVDVVVRGEGEECLVDLVGQHARQKDPAGVLGATWRNPSGCIVRNPDRPFREDLDGLPWPSWHLLNIPQYLAFGDGASVLSSRGCPHRCVFCVGRKMIGAKGRFRRPGDVADEMEALAKIGFQRIRIEDDLFTFQRDRTIAICRELLGKNLSIRWRAYARVDTVDLELLSWMRRSGCERLMFGAESGSPAILRNIRKKITPEMTRRAVEMTRAAGIDVLASFVLGLPGETPETLRQTLDFAESLGVPYSLNLLTPYKGTEIRERAEELGIRILSSDWRRYSQGKPLTATEEVGPWHFRRALGEYKRKALAYQRALLREQGLGTIKARLAEKLKRERDWAFLRRLIGEELIERYGTVSAESDGRGLDELSEKLSVPLALSPGDVKRHLQLLARTGLLSREGLPDGAARWSWTSPLRPTQRS